VDSGRLHKITWYCDRGITASGGHTHLGIVATIRRDIPFGTKVTIDGIGTFVVEDRIGHGSEFDIWIPSCSEATDKKHGAKFRRVTIG
jgi:3D (Asp-Asp-Asp) domain-containing protein